MSTRSRFSIQVESRYCSLRRFLNGVVCLSPLNPQIDMLFCCSGTVCCLFFWSWSRMSRMVAALKWSALLLILLGWTQSASATTNGKSFEHCERVVKRWAVSALNQKVEEDTHTLRDLLFFLHIPRTGGRTYFHCFLKKLYPNALECPRSYDKLRFDPSKPKCRLLVTHDDYSMMSKLPRERTSVVTILRNPVDRVFSTYEFSVEVAARFLIHPNLTSATRMAARLRNKSKGVSTLDIWPWKYLVPWMREDLFARRGNRRLNGSGYIKGNDPYDMEEMVIPLHEYINDPIAQDIVHNGATFQVAGLTNNSYIPESHEVRRCVMQHKELGDHVLQVAKKRLDNMMYVGLTEDHKESATMFANVVGAQVISQLKATNSTWVPAAQNKPAEQTASVSESDDEHNQSISSDKEQKENEKASSDYGEPVKENLTVKELMRAYESCISGLRKAQGRRRVTSLKKISPANFTKEARLHVKEEVLDEIRSLNHLDMELYEYAKAIYGKESKLATQKSLASEKLTGSSSYPSITVWNLILLGTPVILVCVFIYAFINVRRISKIKV